MKCVKDRSTAELVEKGSRFIATVAPIVNETEAKAMVDLLWQQYPNAHHVCFAYRLGPDGTTYRAYDDGEPSGSAGLPIYNRLRSHNLTHTLAAVVRYFGGTKLGIAGLISAYSIAVDLAIDKALLIEHIEMAWVELQFDVAQIGKVERMISMLRLEVAHRQFSDHVILSFQVPLNRANEVVGRFQELPSVKAIKK